MSTLSSVVSKLVRASHGSAIPDSVPDEDLDRVVADLILKEARDKEIKYTKEGIGAYLPNGGLGDNNLPKANKRFLTAILRNVDEHNASVIRQQQLAAELAREEHEKAEIWERIREDEEREDQLEKDRRERRRKDADQAKDRMRRLLGNNLRRDEGRGRNAQDHANHRNRDRRKEEDEYHPSRRSGSSSQLDAGTRDRRRRRDGYESSPRPSKRRREGRDYDSPPPARKRYEEDNDSPRRASRPHRRGDDDSPPPRRRRELASDEDEDVWRPSRRRSRSPHRQKSPGRLVSKDEEKVSTSKSALPLHPALLDLDDEPAGPASPPMSKMDRYFDESYDPRLDIQVSKEGFIEPGQFEGWDHMLEILKLRKEEKRLKEWQRAAEEYAEDRKGKKKKRTKEEREREREIEEHGKPIQELLEENRRKLAEFEQREKGLMDVVYKKRGEAREWDKGKVTF